MFPTRIICRSYALNRLKTKLREMGVKKPPSTKEPVFHPQIHAALDNIRKDVMGTQKEAQDYFREPRYRHWCFLYENAREYEDDFYALLLMYRIMVKNGIPKERIKVHTERLATLGMKQEKSLFVTLIETGEFDHEAALDGIYDAIPTENLPGALLPAYQRIQKEQTAKLLFEEMMESPHQQKEDVILHYMKAFRKEKRLLYLWERYQFTEWITPACIPFLVEVIVERKYRLRLKLMDEYFQEKGWQFSEFYLVPMLQGYLQLELNHKAVAILRKREVLEAIQTEETLVSVLSTANAVCKEKLHYILDLLFSIKERKIILTGILWEIELLNAFATFQDRQRVNRQIDHIVAVYSPLSSDALVAILQSLLSTNQSQNLQHYYKQLVTRQVTPSFSLLSQLCSAFSSHKDSLLYFYYQIIKYKYTPDNSVYRSLLLCSSSLSDSPMQEWILLEMKIRKNFVLAPDFVNLLLSAFEKTNQQTILQHWFTSVQPQ